MATERFMRQHYGASGFAPHPHAEDVPFEFRLAAVTYCRDRHPEKTLGEMLEMARFAEWLSKQPRLGGSAPAGKEE